MSHLPEIMANMTSPDFSADVRISCDDCLRSSSDECAGCLVTFICAADDAAQEPRAIVLDLEEQRAVRRLQEAGLLPRLRHRRRAG